MVTYSEEAAEAAGGIGADDTRAADVTMKDLRVTPLFDGGSEVGGGEDGGVSARERRGLLLITVSGYFDSSQLAPSSSQPSLDPSPRSTACPLSYFEGGDRADATPTEAPTMARPSAILRIFMVVWVEGVKG